MVVPTKLRHERLSGYHPLLPQEWPLFFKGLATNVLPFKVHANPPGWQVLCFICLRIFADAIMRSHLSSSRGSRRGKLAYTLVEVLMAMAVVAIAFIGLYRGIAFSFDVTRFERENLRATQILLRRIEGIRLYNWNQVTDTTLNPLSFSEAYLPGGGSGGLVYTGSVQVATAVLDPAATYSNNMKQITITVTWRSAGVLRTRTASTYVARDGIQNYIYGPY